MIKEAAASIKKVWNYEKTINADIRALQNMLVIFAIVMLLIDVENFKLGKYVIGAYNYRSYPYISLVIRICNKGIRNCTVFSRSIEWSYTCIFITKFNICTWSSDFILNRNSLWNNEYPNAVSNSISI